MRELQLWSAESGLDQAFDDISTLSGGCRFVDCAHDGEPGCAVAAAIEAGSLDAERPASWRKLSREAANGGMALVGRVIEVASGLPFEEYVERHVFAPLGMRHSTFRQPPSPSLASRVATAGSGPVPDALLLAPAGAMVSTAADMSRFMRAHLNAGALGSARIVDSTTAAHMHAAQWQSAKTVPGVALGFFTSDVGGVPGLFHTGARTHFSLLYLVPEHNRQATVSITREEIEKRNPVDTWQMLTNISSVTIAVRDYKVVATSRRALISRFDNEPCFLRVMVDGIMLNTGPTQMDFDLRGAFVSILSTSIRVGTGPNGRFRITKVPPGQYLLIVRRGGYSPTSAVVDVPVADTLRLSYTLTQAATTLEGVTVTEKAVSFRMLEFEQRRRLGFGEFMTEAEIERRGSVFPTELFRKFGTINVAPSHTRSLTEYFALSRREGGNPTLGACPMTVYLDHVPLPTPFNLDLLPSPKNIAGIEVYAGSATIPPQFNGFNRGCGVILVWTKEGY